jgi:hypothetical protein
MSGKSRAAKGRRQFRDSPVSPKLENIPFETEGLDSATIIERADAMARRYQLRIEGQLSTIQRLLDGSTDREEISRLHEELANARAASYGLADVVSHRTWTQYEDKRGLLTDHQVSNPEVYPGPPVRQRHVVEAYGPWTDYAPKGTS